MRWLLAAVASFAMLLAGCRPHASGRDRYDVVIYGGSFAGYAAARQIARFRPKSRVLIIVPQRILGEIGTAGAQNYWDLINFPKLAQQGSFPPLLRFQGKGYDPEDMADFLLRELQGYRNVEIVFLHDVETVEREADKIASAAIRPLRRRADDAWIFRTESPARRVAADVWIDASFNGRLMRLAGFTGVIGRNDYARDSRQMAVTMMFRIRGFDVQAATAFRPRAWHLDPDKDGSLVLDQRYSTPEMRAAFAKIFGKRGKFKGGMNMAEGRPGEFWINGFVLYDVDATKEEKDRGTPRFPRNDLMSLDQGYAEFRRIVESDAFLQALRALPGMQRVQIERLGDMLYVRESLHASRVEDPTIDDFAIDANEMGMADFTPEGRDRENYPTRIGLLWYGMDFQGYLIDDPFKQYIRDVSAHRLRAPSYAPYEVLLDAKLRNLLICGYGVNVGSIPWSAVRVLPNAVVLGDAAGVSATVALDTRKEPHDLARAEIDEIQRRLRSAGAKLEKDGLQFGAASAPKMAATRREEPPQKPTPQSR